MKDIVYKIKRVPDYALNKLLMLRWKNKIEYALKNAEGKATVTIAHVTYHFCGNAGDNILSACVRKLFEDYCSDYCVNWRIIPVAHKVTAKTIETINECDLCIIGGGGLFLPDTNSNNFSGWQWAVSEDQLNEIKIPIVIFAVGYNYFPGQKINELSRKGITAIIQKSSFAGFRNRGSVNSLTNLMPGELKHKPIYQPCPTTLINNLFPIRRTGQVSAVGLNIAFDRIEARLGNNYVNKLNQVAEAARKISDKGIKIVYIAHCGRDTLFLEYLKRYSVDYEVRKLWNLNPTKAMQAYLDIDVMMGMRGHAQMVPFGIGCGIVTLGSHDKMRWFMQDTGLEEAYIDMNATISLSDTIVDVFAKLYMEDSSRIFTLISKAQADLLRITDENMRRITALINPSNVQENRKV